MTRPPPVSPDVPGDRDLVSWWGHVIEGFHHTHALIAAPVEREFGLPAAPAEVILRLGRTPGHRLPMSRIARETALTSGGFTKLADRLIGMGLVHRARDENDRRVIHLELTAQGERVAVRVEALTAQALRAHLLAAVGVDRARSLSDTMLALRETT
ncbi:DNA-binding MarR family transcriptional regulator [Nakamurella sp. UYEF19]|uniref:MarR family winged helix-turn-helix transcriptional regulator n=1 Tax=Nakamurella sp. UYEF19 TaxID=1756392 RepID=UPI003391C51F